MSPGQPNAALLASLRILYQPVMRLSDMRADYVEVLARAAGADGAMQGPQCIVDAMDNATQALKFSTAIMRLGIAEYAAHGFAADGISLAFNLPLEALLHPRLTLCIEELRAWMGLNPAALRFELTETHPVKDFAAASAAILALQKAGYGIALDDISPCMPYLDELMRLPILAIKFDHALVNCTSPQALDFIGTMAARATAQGQAVIAEGIETQTQLNRMRAAGVTHGQGYLFSRPLAALVLKTFLRPQPKA